MPKVKKFKKKKQVSESIKRGLYPQVSDFLARKDARDVETYVALVVENFKKYIKSMVVWGSMKTKQGKRKTSDIDIAIIVDDTDVKTMTRSEVKEKLFQKLLAMAYPISKKLHPQPYLLTEFWEYVRIGNPVLFNVLRDGVPVFDTGFFLPVQMLFRMGNIKPSKESIDKHIHSSEELLKLAKSTMKEKLSYYLEQAVVSSSQAVLMELGYRPPTPKETPKFVEEVLCGKEKLVSKKYCKIAQTAVQNYKDIEHKVKKEYTGVEFDKQLKEVNDFVDKMQEVLKKLRKEKGETWKFELADKLKDVKVKRDGIINEKRGIEHEKRAEKIIKEELGQR